MDARQWPQKTPVVFGGLCHGWSCSGHYRFSKKVATASRVIPRLVLHRSFTTLPDIGFFVFSLLQNSKNLLFAICFCTFVRIFKNPIFLYAQHVPESMRL